MFLALEYQNLLIIKLQHLGNILDSYPSFLPVFAECLRATALCVGSASALLFHRNILFHTDVSKHRRFQILMVQTFSLRISTLVSPAFAFEQELSFTFIFHTSKLGHVAVVLVPLLHPCFVVITHVKWMHKKTLKKPLGLLLSLVL